MKKVNTHPQRSYHKVNVSEQWKEAMDDQINFKDQTGRNTTVEIVGQLVKHWPQ